METYKWREAKDPVERVVLRNGEYFRRALESAVAEAGRGSQKEVSFDVGYKHQSMVTNILKGTRIPDLKKAIRIAHFFGSEFIDFLIEGRRLVEPKAAPAIADTNNLTEKQRAAFADLRAVCTAGDPKVQGIVIDMLSTASRALHHGHRPRASHR
jgi:transcriptional regulator with XRE-family HTH domain